MKVGVRSCRVGYLYEEGDVVGENESLCKAGDEVG